MASSDMTLHKGDLGRRASQILEVAQDFADQVRREADQYAAKRRQEAADASVDIERMHAEIARQHQQAVDFAEQAQRAVRGVGLTEHFGKRLLKRLARIAQHGAVGVQPLETGGGELAEGQRVGRFGPDQFGNE